MSGPHNWHRPNPLSHVCNEPDCDFQPPRDPATAYQHLRAPNDPNGNPQRLFIEYTFDDETGYWSTVAVYDDGYHGRPERLRDVPELPPVNISRSDYHARLRNARDRGISK